MYILGLETLYKYFRQIFNVSTAKCTNSYVFYLKLSTLRNLFKVAGYTYGPLLGLFAFGFLTKWKITDKWVPLVCVISPAIAYLIGEYAPQIFDGYKFGFEMIIVNGLITFMGLMLLRRNEGALK